MPFVTEELWSQTGDRAEPLMLRPWPHLEGLHDAGAEAEMDWVVRLVSTVRGVRAEMNVPPSTQVDLLCGGLDSGRRGWAGTHGALITRLARLARFDVAAPAEALAQAFSHGAAQLVVDGATFVLPLGGVIDVDKERARLDKELAVLAGDIAKIDKKLGNADFVAKAKPEVVEEQKERRAEAVAAQEKLKEALGRLSGA
jgi:valyl-tRNA synthetase